MLLVVIAAVKHLSNYKLSNELSKTMAELSKANLDYILKWEGGLSKHPRDSAARHPVPDGSGYHTNKGVTWRVFRSIYGSGQDAVVRFYRMTQDDFRGIYKLYWNGVKADSISSQILAEYATDFAWGSGVAGASRQIQKWLNSQGYKVGVDGKIGNQTITAINQLIEDKGEKIAFESLDSHRRHFLSRLRDFDVFGRGWYNRLNDFVSYAYLNING
jgi:lysozyme family protein